MLLLFSSLSLYLACLFFCFLQCCNDDQPQGVLSHPLTVLGDEGSRACCRVIHTDTQKTMVLLLGGRLGAGRTGTGGHPAGFAPLSSSKDAAYAPTNTVFMSVCRRVIGYDVDMSKSRGSRLLRMGSTTLA